MKSFSPILSPTFSGPVTLQGIPTVIFLFIFPEKFYFCASHYSYNFCLSFYVNGNVSIFLNLVLYLHSVF